MLFLSPSQQCQCTVELLMYVLLVIFDGCMWSGIDKQYSCRACSVVMEGDLDGAFNRRAFHIDSTILQHSTGDLPSLHSTEPTANWVETGLAGDSRFCQMVPKLVISEFCQAFRNQIRTSGMGDHLQMGKHLSISPSHRGQLSLLPSVGREMSTSQSVVMLCGWK